MRDACIASVNAALRARGMDPMTQVQERGIEQRIAAERLQGARENPAAWRALSPDQQLIEAGKRAAEALIAETKKKTQRVGQTILAHDRIENYRHSQVANGDDANGVDALERTLVHKYDEASGGFQSVEERANATFDLTYSQVSEVFDLLNPGLWRRILDGQWTMEPLRRAFTDAVHGVEGPHIPAPLKRAADVYREVSDALREQFNAAGGVIGKLEDFGVSHLWSERLLQKRGRAEYVNDMTRWANRRRYVHDNGRAYTETELREFFTEAWNTIVSGGWNKDETPASFPGGAVKANRGSHHRVIHIEPRFAYEALTRYSEQNIMEAMIGGLRRMSRDVALVETYGPNADYQFKLQMERAIQEGVKIDPTQRGALEGKARRLQYLYDALAGNNPHPESRKVQDFFATLRNIQIFKLGSSAITSITDMESLYKTALQNRLNPVKVMLNSTLAWLPGSRRYVRRLGLVVETMVSDLERISGENITARTLSAKTASGVIRASALSFVTNARRIGFSMTMLDTIGHLTRQYADVTKLKADDYRILAAKGIDQQTWDIWKKARIDNWGANHTLLTPEAIMAVDSVPLDARRNAAIKLLGIVRSEQDLAIITPGQRQRTMMQNFFGATRPGSIGGEIARSVFVFKSFAITLQQRNWERAHFYNPGKAGKFGRYTYMAQMMITMMILGAVANWIKDMAQFKDPRPLWSNDPDMRSIVTRNWIHAALAGGGLGVYGDFLFAENSRSSSNTALETAAGPVLGTVGAALNITTGNIPAALAGEDTDLGAEAVRFARGNIPFANLPYTRGVADRAIFFELQEMTNPGSVQRMQQRQRQNQGTQYWWSPSANPLEGEGPERAPEIAN